MSKLTNELLNIVRSSEDVLVLRSTINTLAAALFEETEEKLHYKRSEEADFSVAAAIPVASAFIAPEAPAAPVEAASVASGDLRAEKYNEIYGEGGFLLLDDEDEIEEGDEWIIKPECDTNRARRWREATDIGNKVGDFERSHYRRAI